MEKRLQNRLASVQQGQEVTVLDIQGHRHVRRRLMELGLLPGTRVAVIGRSPWGDPIKLRLRHYQLSIRTSDAESIVVESHVVESHVVEGHEGRADA